MQTHRLPLQLKPGQYLLAGFLIIFLLLPGTVLADAYLDALKAAAGDVEVDPNSSQAVTDPGSDSPATPTSGSDSTAIQAGLSQDAFERYLQQNFLGSFSFYRRLDSNLKRQIFEAYQERPEIEYLRQQIKQRYLNR